MTLFNRVKQLEERNSRLGNNGNGKAITDEERMTSIKQLACKIARAAKAQGVTAADDPRLSLPLAIAEAVTNKTN